MERQTVPTNLDATLYNLFQSDVLRDLRNIAAATLDEPSERRHAVELAECVARNLGLLYHNPFGLGVRGDLAELAYEQFTRLGDAGIDEPYLCRWADFLRGRAIQH